MIDRKEVNMMKIDEKQKVHQMSKNDIMIDGRYPDNIMRKGRKRFMQEEWSKTARRILYSRRRCDTGNLFQRSKVEELQEDYIYLSEST